MRHAQFTNISLWSALLFAMQIACISGVNSNSITSSSEPSVDMNFEEELIDAKFTKDFADLAFDRITKPIGDRVEFASFSSVNHGWLVGDATLYSTDDGGTTWKRMPVPAATNGRVAFVKRVSRDEGWLAIQIDEKKSAFSKGDLIEIYRTENGGRSFDLTLSEPSVTFVDAFFDERYGIIIGNRFAGNAPLRLKPYLKTMQNGVWQDGSVKIESFLERNFEGLRSLEKVGVSSGCFDVVTTKTEIVRSCDGAQTWTTVFGRPVEQDPFGVRTISQIDQSKIWILESAGGLEGSGTKIMILDSSKRSIERVVLKGAFAKFGFRLSEDKQILVLEDPENEVKAGHEFIIYSSDKGRNWDRVRILDSSGRFITGFSSSANKIRVVGDDGSIFESNSF